MLVVSYESADEARPPRPPVEPLDDRRGELTSRNPVLEDVVGLDQARKRGDRAGWRLRRRRGGRSSHPTSARSTMTRRARLAARTVPDPMSAIIRSRAEQVESRIDRHDDLVCDLPERTQRLGHPRAGIGRRATDRQPWTQPQRSLPPTVASFRAGCSNHRTTVHEIDLQVGRRRRPRPAPRSPSSACKVQLVGSLAVEKLAPGSVPPVLKAGSAASRSDGCGQPSSRLTQGHVFGDRHRPRPSPWFVTSREPDGAHPSQMDGPVKNLELGLGTPPRAAPALANKHRSARTARGTATEARRQPRPGRLQHLSDCPCGRRDADGSIPRAFRPYTGDVSIRARDPMPVSDTEVMGIFSPSARLAVEQICEMVEAAPGRRKRRISACGTGRQPRASSGRCA